MWRIKALAAGEKGKPLLYQVDYFSGEKFVRKMNSVFVSSRSGSNFLSMLSLLVMWVGVDDTFIF